MNPQPDQDLERRLQKLEVEINQTPPHSPLQPKQPLRSQTKTSQPAQMPFRQLNHWFNGLSGFGKLIVVGVATLVSLAVLQAVLKLVVAVISLTISAVILYLIYQFFLARSSETKE